MPQLPIIYGEYRAVADPELRFTPNGKAVANLRVVATSRKKENDEWVDDKECWLNVTVWQRMAENVAETVTKGSLILVIGRLETRAYETREGEKRQSYDVTADYIGPSLTWDAARIIKTERTGGQSNAGQGSQAAGQAAAGQGNQDPWGAPSTANDEPPF